MVIRFRPDAVVLWVKAFLETFEGGLASGGYGHRRAGRSAAHGHGTAAHAAAREPMSLSASDVVKHH